jgi:Mrp family chromosome partitioning ATPase
MSRILDRLKQAQIARGEGVPDTGNPTLVPSPFASDRIVQPAAAIERSAAPPSAAPDALGTDPIAQGQQPPVLPELAEETAQLFARLRPLLEERGSLILHVASANPGEGTSTVAQALARHGAATRRHRTLLIDANPAHSTRLSSGPAIGLVESHRARAEVAASVNVVESEALGTVALATPATYEAGLPEYAEIERIYNALRSQWPLIIIDAAPVLHSVDILNIAPLSDGVLLVVEAERSRTPVVKRAKDQLQSTGAHIIGVVLNRRRFHIPPLLYKLI